jgi:hypothetical protein
MLIPQPREKHLCSFSHVLEPKATAEILRFAQDDRRLIFHTFVVACWTSRRGRACPTLDGEHVNHEGTASRPLTARRKKGKGAESQRGERHLVPKHYQRGRALTPLPDSSVRAHPRPKK